MKKDFPWDKQMKLSQSLSKFNFLSIQQVKTGAYVARMKVLSTVMKKYENEGEWWERKEKKENWLKK